jgi:hypothetical protein
MTTYIICSVCVASFCRTGSLACTLYCAAVWEVVSWRASYALWLLRDCSCSLGLAWNVTAHTDTASSSSTLQPCIPGLGQSGMHLYGVTVFLQGAVWQVLQLLLCRLAAECRGTLCRSARAVCCALCCTVVLGSNACATHTLACAGAVLVCVYAVCWGCAVGRFLHSFLWLLLTCNAMWVVAGAMTLPVRQFACLCFVRVSCSSGRF